MSSKSRFIPYSKDFKIFKSRSLPGIPENINMPSDTEVPSVTVNTNDIFNSLKIPDAIKDLPKFDGNPRLLYEFIGNVEEILLHIRGADNTTQG